MVFRSDRRRKSEGMRRLEVVLAAVVLLALAAALPRTLRGNPPRAAAAALPSSGAPSGTPSVLLLVVDTLRADAGNLGAGPDAAIPNFLKNRGTHFDNAVAAGDWTSPSVLGLLTGRYPSDCRLLSTDSVAEYPPAWTIQSRLRAAGYRTAAVVSNPVLTGTRLNLSAGFDVFDDRMTARERNRAVGIRPAPETTEAALAALTDLHKSGKSWFLWIQYLEPHGPYRAPSGYPRMAPEPGPAIATASGDIAGRGFLPRYQFQPDARGRNDYVTRYQSSAAWSLDEADRFLTLASQKGYLRDTVVIFTSDHGEFLGEQDFWFQHGVHLDPAVVHVPLVIARTAAEPLSREARPVSHLDVLPTILALRNAAAEPLPGEDLFGKPGPRRVPIVTENIAFPDSAEVGIVVGNRLLVKSTESAPEEFRIDAGEWPELSGEPARVSVELVDAELKRVRRLPIPMRKVPPEEIQKLRDLGYIK